MQEVGDRRRRRVRRPMSPEAKGIAVAGLALAAVFVMIFTTMSGSKLPADCPTLTALPSPLATAPAQAGISGLTDLRDLAQAGAIKNPLRAPHVPARTVLVAQANLYDRMSAEEFQHDLATVTSGGPDFVTLNETYDRTLDQLEPTGYQAWRSEAPFDARETPVLWRTDRWRLLDQGTLLMHYQRGKWGIRYVNWVTLAATRGGQVVSVISAHASPPGPGRGALLGQFLSRLDDLVTALRPRGPVIVGGDFNADYLIPGTRSFLLDGFAAMHAIPTVASLGAPQGGYRTDHAGGALDYVVLAGARALRQGVSPLTYADHKMVRALVRLPARQEPMASRVAQVRHAGKSSGGRAALAALPASTTTTVPSPASTPPAKVSQGPPAGCTPVG